MEKILKLLMGDNLLGFLHNIKYLNKLKKNKDLYKRFSINRKVWQSISHVHIKKINVDIPWLDAGADLNEIKNTILFESFTEIIQQNLLEWSKNGYMIIPSFFQKEEIEEAEKSILPSLSKEARTEYTDNRVINLYKHNPNIDRIFKNEILLQILSFIFGKDVRPFKTTNFYKSSSQKAHSDSLHLTTEPVGYLLGVWVALEDILPGSGEFIFYPGSHKLNYIFKSDLEHDLNSRKNNHTLNNLYEAKVASIIEQNNLKAVRFLPKKGDILIWHGNLLHGSLPKADLSITRKSLIMHYFAKGVLCYHELSGKPAII